MDKKNHEADEEEIEEKLESVSKRLEEVEEVIKLLRKQNRKQKDALAELYKINADNARKQYRDKSGTSTRPVE